MMTLAEKEAQKRYFKTPKGKATLKKYMQKQRVKLIELLGSKCVMCGFSDIRAIQIDHINGNGIHDRKTISINFHKHYLSNSELAKEKLKLLCANCNWIKRYELQEWR